MSNTPVMTKEEIQTALKFPTFEEIIANDVIKKVTEEKGPTPNEILDRTLKRTNMEMKHTFTFAMMKRPIQVFQIMHTHLTKDKMIMLYGFHLGNHLWNKRESYGYGEYLQMHDEEKFFESMDEGNQKLMFYWACTFFDD